MNNNSRIIHGFSDRLAIDREVKNLAKARNAYQQDQMVKALAVQGKPVLNALLRHLDTSDPKLRGGLGRLAQHMDPEIIIPALRRAAMDESRSEAARMTAVMLLERYLDQEIDPILAQHIPASYDVARESGEEAIAIAETEPLVLVEYAEQLLDEPPEIVRAVLQVIIDMDDPRRVRLLMAIAAYGDSELQKEIIPVIGSVRDPLSMQALQTLWRLASPELQPLVRRQFQKLRLSGVKSEDLGELRMLWSPVNAQGHSFLWIIRARTKEATGDLLTLILQEQLGVVYATAYPHLDIEALPLPAPLGAIRHVPMIEGGQRMMMAEIDPMLGMQLVDNALQTMKAEALPWPGEMVVFGHWIWEGQPLPPPQKTWPRLPKPVDTLDETTAQALLDHPAFAGWVWTLPDLSLLLQGHKTNALSKNGLLHRQISEILVNDNNRPLLAQRLLQQAQWLILARDRKTAMQTMAVREAVLAADSEHPFVRKLAWRSLITAAADRAMRNALKSVRQMQDDTPADRRSTPNV